MKTNQRNQDKQANNVSLRTGDPVVIIAGKDRGKKGKVTFVDPVNNICVVDNANIVVKHKKARNAQQKSSREKQPGQINISNVQILCKCGKATRVSHKEVGGVKHRVCAKCGEILDKKYVKLKEKAKEEKETEKKDEEKQEKKPLQRREVKHTADVKIKQSSNAGAPNSASTHRKIGS